MSGEKLGFQALGQLRNTICAGSSRASGNQLSGPSSAKCRRVGPSEGGEPLPSTGSVNDLSLQDHVPGAAIAAAAERPEEDQR